MGDTLSPRPIEKTQNLIDHGQEKFTPSTPPIPPGTYFPPLRDGPSIKPLVRGLTISVPWDDIPNTTGSTPLRSSSGISMNEFHLPKLSRHASTDSHWSFTSDSDMMCLGSNTEINEEDEIEEVVRLEAEVEWLQSELKSLKLQLSLLEEHHKEPEPEVEPVSDKESKRAQILAASLKELEQELDCTQLYRELEKKKNDELEATLQKTTSLKAEQLSLFISSPVSSPGNSNLNSPVLSPMTLDNTAAHAEKDGDDDFSFNTLPIANSFDIVKEDENAEKFPLDNIPPSPRESISSQPVELSILMVKTMGSIYRRYAQTAKNNGQGNGPLRRLPSLEKRRIYLTERERSTGMTDHGGFGSMAVSSMLNSVGNSMDMRDKDKYRFDPYGTMDEVIYGDVGPYSNLLEVTFLPEDKEQTSIDAPALAKYKSLADELMEVDPVKMTHDERVAFWINLYNAITMHAYLAYGVPQTNYKRAMLMQKVTYMVGGMKFNILAMEYAVLRACSSRPALTGLPSDVRFKPNDVRYSCALEKPEPYVNFALCCGARSSPALRVFTAKNLRNELHAAARDFLQASIGISKGDKIIVPKILKWYCKDFASDIHSLLEWIVELLPRPQRTFVYERLPKRRGGTARIMQVASFDWSFRYLISPEPF